MPGEGLPDRLMSEIGNRTLVMGIVNCTPDSFYPASRKTTVADALETALRMVDSGVDIVDVGGESTRPGSEPVPAEEEIERVCPLIEAIGRRDSVLISIDTTKSVVARTALRAGAGMVNDISGFKGDQGMAAVVAGARVPVALMHMRGMPRTMQSNPFYADAVGEVIAELQESVGTALRAGVQKSRIILDPGIGFGKRLEDNLRIIRHLRTIRELGFPLLIGISRKSFLGLILDRPVEQRLIGTVAANTVAIMNGADIIRVHDYAEAVQMVRVIDAIRTA